MEAYKNRMEKMGNKSNKANMSLSLQRKLAENMAIAKARQLALGKYVSRVMRKQVLRSLSLSL